MIVIAGTAAPGGIAQVITGYARDGIFAKWNIRWVKTHVAGNLPQRLWAACRGLCAVTFWLACGRVQLVHAHAAMRGSFWRKSLLVMLCRFFRVPVIIHLHGSEMKNYYSEQPRPAQWWIRFTLEQADRVIVLSPGWASYIRAIAPAAALTILPNYSPAIPPLTKPTRLFKSEQKFIFLFLGALIDRKGIYELLPAFVRLTADYPDVELWIGGTGETGKVQAALGALDKNQVRLLGWVDEAAKIQLLRSADAFVLPSKNENLPMALIEAMSAALPIITTNVGGIPEMLLDGRDGILIKPGQADLLYQALHAVRSDPARARRMAENALKRYETEFSREVGLPQVDAVYTQVLRGLSR